MKLGILSDTHDRVDRTSAAIRLLVAEGADALIHCGDLTGPDIVYECHPLPAYFVFGNNDYETRELRAAMDVVNGICLERGGEISLASRTIAVTHGDSSAELRRLSGRCPDYLFFGHSHQRADDRIGPTRFINPGALHRAPLYTVALLDLETDELRFLEVRKDS